MTYKKDGNSFAKIQEELRKIAEGNKKNFADGDKDKETYWQPKRDKAGNATALIRFLPGHSQDDLPWVQYFRHAFQGSGGWYIENSLTTLNQADPVADLNRELWATKVEANIELAKKQKRKLVYVSNILVIKDPTTPENNGKVFKYRYGQKIFEKITALLTPENDGVSKVKSVNVFCPYEGADFVLKIKEVSGFPNYDASRFETPSPLFDGDEKLINEVCDKQYLLKGLIAPDQFKTYAQLKKRLDIATGVIQRKRIEAASVEEIEPEEIPSSESSNDTTGDDLDYLSRLAAGD
jgi:gp32 DNA binding protein like